MPETVVHFQIRMPPDLYEKLASWAKGDKFPSTLSSWRHFRKRWRITNRTTRQASDCSPIAHRGGAVIAMATFADLDIRFHLSQGPDHRGVRLRRPGHLPVVRRPRTPVL